MAATTKRSRALVGRKVYSRFRLAFFRRRLPSDTRVKIALASNYKDLQ
jgi:hypothetical protein